MKHETIYVIMMNYENAFSHPYKIAYKTKTEAYAVMRAIALYNKDADTIWVEKIEIEL